jgi:hypothetical protein
VQIPRTDAADGWGGTDTAMGSSKGKGKATPSIGSDDKVSSDDDIIYRDGGGYSAATGPQLAVPHCRGSKFWKWLLCHSLTQQWLR